MIMETELGLKEIGIATFNVRSINDEVKQEQLSKDIVKYRVQICALQECKIKAGIDRRIGEERSRLITFSTKQKAYGNGFIVSADLACRIYKCWKVDDRACVIQINMDKDIDESQHLLCKYKSLNQARKQNNPDESVPKKLLNIINVYGPTKTLVKQDVKMLDKLYTKLSNLLNDFEKKSGSINIV